MCQLFFMTNPYMKFQDDISNEWTDTQTNQNQYALKIFQSWKHRIVNTCHTQFYSIGVVLRGRNYMGMHVSMMNGKYLAFWFWCYSY